MRKNNMQICIAGWYYCKEFLEFFTDSKNVYIVAHRPGNSLNIPCVIIENVGLEFNCYDYFVKNVWDKKSDVLFCHDDIKIKDISFLYELEQINAKITMVWSSEVQRRKNLAHGRMFKCSCEYLSGKKGFWWDQNNRGSLSASKGCNNGIINLYHSSKKILNHFFTDKIDIGKRGKV
ncbi:MAG: hypothetical protein IMZ63_00115 [Actinobacteria bacterium]|nr:hypothetical protein [Actinomycetota bacterium]